ncbi:MAG: protein translocase subunit SecF [Actinomycetota bacterium]|nr:protein translocase subunit SecF [Actinomycetota bacterium]
MSLRTELHEGTNDIDLVPIWKRTLPGSVVLTVLSIVLLIVLGLNMSIDFDGGGIFEVPVEESVTVADARAAVDVADARVQTVENIDGQRFIRVQTGSEELDNADAIVAAMAELGGVEPDLVSVNTIGPTWGDEITGRALRALVFFFIAVALYMAWSLEWVMAIGALAAVVHDLVLTAAVYSIFRFEVSPGTVIALLTIMGYSLYDTVVVYDKVREYGADVPKVGYTRMVNTAMNRVMMRSINTTLTTVLPVVAMLIIGGFFLGGATLRGFALALFVGLLLGTYSSIFLAAPLLAWLKERGLGVAKA